MAASADVIGYLWMLWDREKQTWHDKVASAYVVPADAVATGGVADPWAAERAVDEPGDDEPGPDLSGTTFR